jgi:hypothetical protein
MYKYFFTLISIIHQSYPKTLHRNAYILTIWLFYTSSAYKSDQFGLMLYYLGLIHDDGPLRTQTCRNVKCDITI